MTHQQQIADTISTANALAVNTLSDAAYRRQLEAETRRVAAGLKPGKIDTPALCDLYYVGKDYWYSGACDHVRRPSFTWRGCRYRLESTITGQLRVFCESGRVSIKGSHGSATQDQYERAGHAR